MSFVHVTFHKKTVQNEMNAAQMWLDREKEEPSRVIHAKSESF